MKDKNYTPLAYQTEEERTARGNKILENRAKRKRVLSILSNLKEGEVVSRRELRDILSVDAKGREVETLIDAVSVLWPVYEEGEGHDVCFGMLDSGEKPMIEICSICGVEDFVTIIDGKPVCEPCLFDTFDDDGDEEDEG